jgi:hypothetical protein
MKWFGEKYSAKKYLAAGFLALGITALGLSAQARMITPDDPGLRAMDGGRERPVSERSTIGSAVETAVVEIKNKLQARWNQWIGGTPAKAPAPPAPVAGAPAPAPVQSEAITELTTVLKAASDQVKALGPTTVTEQGRPAAPDLKRTSKGDVPYFPAQDLRDLKIVKKIIPRLDVGLEPSIKKTDFLPADLKKFLQEPGKAVALKTPPALEQKLVEAWTNMKIESVKPWLGPQDGDFGLGKIVTFEKVEKVDVEMKPEQVMEALKPTQPVTEDDLKMLSGVIIFNRQNQCHMASGLLHDVSANPKYKDEANFMLGVCADKMGFHSEAVKRLSLVVASEDSDYGAAAVENLVDGLPSEYEADVARLLENLKNKALITEKAKSAASYILGRGAYQKDRWSDVAQYAAGVAAASPLYPKAQYLKGIAQYAVGQDRAAEKTLEDLRAHLAAKKDDKNLRALIAANLGRIKFKIGRFEAANEDFLKVPKDHPLWVEGLIEQGWTQLSQGDPAGAIGNMYSLHSPYFKSVFMPESWVVRTIGYIDICQYGDAYRTLAKHEKMHGDYVKQIKGYLDVSKKPEAYYQTVRSYLKGQSDRAVDGLPGSIIREVARQRAFLNIQDSINRAEDELTQYDFIDGLVAKEVRGLEGRRAKALERAEKLKGDLAKIEKQKELGKNQLDWEASLKAESALARKLEFEIFVAQQNQKGYQRMKTLARTRIDKEKSEFRVAAGRQLQQQLKDMNARLESILEGNEFLRYEIFAGSGEDIRYQAAGGRTIASQKIPANVKPQKILNWEFDGEYWEDEIGSYRSTLRNNCPNKTAKIGKASGG